jgi:hypothetical protein
VEPGIYLTFFTRGERFDSELPPIGPLDHVVVRDRQVLAERKTVQHVEELGGGSRWLEAELELQRAMGYEPGGARRPDLRVGAPGGVYLRFASFGGEAEHDPVPELGPYAVVVLGRTGVDADGEMLASRTGTKQQLWELTRHAGIELAGLVRPDIAFRSSAGTYHPRIRPASPARRAGGDARQSTKPVTLLGPKPPIAAPAEPAAAPSVPAEDSTRREVQTGPTLRTRISTEQASRPTRAAAEIAARSDWREVAWRFRFVLITALIALLALAGLSSVFRGPLTGASATVVGLGTVVRGEHWEYSVSNVSRTTAAGAATARGMYVMVQVVATNRGSDQARLRPGDFALLDGNGFDHAPLPETDPVYLSDVNFNSPYVWTSSYPVGRAVSTNLVFDIAGSLGGLQLEILDVPTTRIRLD